MLPTPQNAHLLVEGKNDLHVIKALCAYHRVPEAFDILEPIGASGVESLLQQFRLKLREPDKHAVGIVVDADTDLAHRWQLIRKIIQQHSAAYQTPSQPNANGLVVPSPHEYLPRIGIWLMPDNQSSGDLEQFAAFLIPPTDPLRPYVRGILEQLEAANLHRYHHKRSKAFIHTWLAWQENPGQPIGTAITAQALSANSPLAIRFIQWLNHLFNPKS